MELNWKDWIVGLLSVTRGWPCAVAFSTTLPGGDERKSKRQPRFTVHRMHIVWCVCVCGVWCVCGDVGGLCVACGVCVPVCGMWYTYIWNIRAVRGVCGIYVCVDVCALWCVCVRSVWCMWGGCGGVSCVWYVWCVCGTGRCVWVCKCVWYVGRVCDVCCACVLGVRGQETWPCFINEGGQHFKLFLHWVFSVSWATFLKVLLRIIITLVGTLFYSYKVK